MIITATKLDSPQLTQSSQRGLWFVCFSLLLHVLIIGMLSQREPALPMPTDPEEERIIEATLIFPPLPAIQNEQATIQSSSEIEEVLEEPIPSPPDIQREPLADSRPSTIPVPELKQPTRPLTSSGLTQRYMQKRNSEQLNGLVEQEVKRYRKQLISPDLQIPAFDSNAEQQPLIKPKIVTCDKTAAKIFAALGNTMGGNMRCRDKPDINEFINRRLNKTRR